MTDMTSTTTKRRSTKEESTNINLYSSGSYWIVTSPSKVTPTVYDTIEGVSDYLMNLGVLDEHIDLALVDMLAKSNTRANFSTNGTFVFSDGAKLYEDSKNNSR